MCNPNRAETSARNTSDFTEVMVVERYKTHIFSYSWKEEYYTNLAEGHKPLHPFTREEVETLVTVHTTTPSV
jgi:hypothetical protein